MYIIVVVSTSNSMFMTFTVGLETSFHDHDIYNLYAYCNMTVMVLHILLVNMYVPCSK